ncbi:glycosyltransferase family 1 protein [Minwuia thermotolerans]|uniref:Glycosyltransferase family 1 protein n=3 Tax=Minwuia thermotolerans TaxID=2056226 RepID=A0A2M9FWR0_9PROT|nr:glycosyltransferase family 1 protein [Minwuia thermotolerans]
MHVVMTVNAAWNIWNFRRDLVAALLAEGHDITVAAPPDDSVAELEALGCRFIPLKMSAQSLSPVEGMKLRAQYKDLFRSQRPDIVLSYTIKNNIFGAMAARACRVPFIPNVTGLGTAFLSGGILQFVAEGLYRQAFSQLPVVFFQNRDDRDLFLARGIIRADQARLLPGSGIDLRRFAAAAYADDAEATIFLMIGRLLRDKGVREFVDAARMVRRHRPDAQFRLLGAVDAANRTAIDRETVARWEREGVVEYLGVQPDVRPSIAAAHCVVLPSYREGAPRTLIEAAAMARPLIATDVPGCRDVVDHGNTGFLCEPGDAASLAAACQTFLSLPRETRAAMGRAGRARMAAAFDQTIVLDAYRKAMAEMTAG